MVSCILRGKRFSGVAKSNGTWRGSCGIARLCIAVMAIGLILASGVSAGTHTTELSFSQDDLRFSSLKGYDVVALCGARWSNRPGKPRLPQVPVRIALPAGCEVADFALVAKDSMELTGDYFVWPSQPPQSLSPDRPVDFVEPMASVYTSDQLYPETAGELVGWGRLGGVTVCDIRVYPLRYRPADRKLVLYTGLTLTVEYHWPGQAPDEDMSRAKPDLVGSLMSEKADGWKRSQRQAPGGAPMRLSGETVSYLIITRDSLAAAFEPLKDWKTRKGLEARIVTVETINFQYSGVDLQERIRNCIKDYYSDSGTDWVLLGGDTQVIPDRKAYVPLSDKPYLPCDLYYSDLDGTWNADGDLYYGEIPSDDINLYADVFVGRAPISNSAEAGLFVTKVLTYEGVYDLPTDYLEDALFVGEVLWGDPADPEDPDYTDGGVAKNMIDSLSVPPAISVEKLYESSGNLDLATMMSSLNQGMNLINVLSHGYYTSMSLADEALTNANVESLLNGPRYGLIYALNCQSGGFDQNDCVGEAWVLAEGGGGFFIGNSRYGWNSPSFPGEGPSDYYDQAFFESIFTTGFTQVGKAHADAKHEYVGESRSDLYMRYIMYGLNLLGDPEMSIWTSVPDTMVAAFDSYTVPGPQTFSVTVTSGGVPVSGARVCLYGDNEVYCVEETGGDGVANLFIAPDDPGPVALTVTDAAHLPVLGTVTVTEQPVSPGPESVIASEDWPSVELVWSTVEIDDLEAYRVYRNTVMVPESLATVPAPDTSFTDFDVEEGVTYYYWVSACGSGGLETELSDVCPLFVEGMTGIPSEPGEGPLVLVKPNPFTGAVSFVINGSPDSEVRIDVFDVRGRLRAAVPVTWRESGGWTGSWQARSSSGEKLPPGMYMVSFSVDKEKSTRKVILLK